MTLSESDALGLQARMTGLIRAFGLHQPDQTPCGQPLPVSEAHAVSELAGVETLGQLELGGRLCLEKSSVSRIVAQLVKRGWVERLAKQEDGRASVLRLTEAGRVVASHLAQARAAKFDQLLSSIPEGERTGILQALDVLTEALHDQTR